MQDRSNNEYKPSTESSLKRTVRPKQKIFIIRSIVLCWKFAHTCKIENKMGWPSWTFIHFLHRKRVFHRKRKKGVRGNECSGRTGHTTQLKRTSVEGEFGALQTYRVFFSNFTLVSELYLFIQKKNVFLPIKLKF